jgi:hypothetical protein
VSRRWVRGRFNGRLEARNDFWGRMWPRREGLFQVERLEGTLHEAEFLDEAPPLDDDSLEVPVRVMPRVEVVSLADGSAMREETVLITDVRLSRLRCFDMRVEALGHGRAGRCEAVLTGRLVTRPAPPPKAPDPPRDARLAPAPERAPAAPERAPAPSEAPPDAPPLARSAGRATTAKAGWDVKLQRRGGFLELLFSALGFLLQLLLFLLALPVLAMAFNWLLHVWNELWLWLPLPAIDTTLLPDGVRGVVEWARLNSGSMAVVTLAVVVLGTLLLRGGRARA